MQIVRTRPEHIARAAEIEKLCFSVPWSKTLLLAELTNPLAHMFSALVRGELAGYCSMQAICGEGYIANVAVDPNHRRVGIGKALVGAMVELSRTLRLDFLSLEARESNAAAIALYSAAGFIVAGIRKDYYFSPAENAVIMTLTLQGV